MTKLKEFFLDDVKEARYDILLRKIEFDRFRCFDKLEISFEERLTVIVAENGGGKTAILDAIAGALKNLLAEFHVEGYQLTEMPVKDVKAGTETGECKLTANIEYLYNSTEVEQKGEDEDGNIVEEETLRIKGRAEKGLVIPYSFGDYVSPFEDEIEHNLIPFSNYEYESSGKKISFPVLAYFGGETVKIEHVENKENSNRLNIIYENALVGNRLQYSNFFNWWFYNYYEKLEAINNYLNFDENRTIVAENVNKGEYEKDGTFIKIRDNLKKINSAIEYLLNDDLSKPTYKKVWVRKVHGKFVMGMNKITYDDDGSAINSIPIEVSQFSAGEKALFAYVADLGIRLLHANPIETSAEDEALYVLKGRGIALIDEIGLHLHVRWQRKIIKKLLEIFPDIQFIITTHSPMIFQAAHPSQRRVLQNNTVMETKNISGLTLEDILDYYFLKDDYSEFNDDEQKLIDEYFKMKDQILKNELTIKDKTFVKLLKNLMEIGGEIEEIVTRDLRLLINSEKIQ